MVRATRLMSGARALFLACFIPAALLAQQPAGPASSAAASDIKPDPAITFGSLKNGLRYQLQHNATPAGQVALRLRFEAGALFEEDNESGIAHLLEHMAFRGSKHYADGEAWKELQRLGLKSGADANALTTLGTTVYQLDLPTNDAKSLETALTLMREIASELTLNPAALDSERNIVASEVRVRTGPLARLADDARAFNFQGRRIGERSPPGRPEVVEHATPEMLRHFYQAWYRPERAVLVAVGDIDVAAFQRQIDKHFGSWKGVGKAGVEPDMGTSANRAFAAHVFSEEGAPPTVAVSWIAPGREGPETLARNRQTAIRDVGLLALTRRMQVLTNAPTPPYRAPAATRASLWGGREVIISVVAQYDGDQWRNALKALEVMRRGTLERGLTQPEVDQAFQLVSQFQKQQVDRAPTRSSVEIAAGQVRILDDDGVPESPAQVLEDYKFYSAGVTAAETTDALKKAFAAAGPLVLLSTPSATTEAVLAQEYQSVQAQPLQAQSTPEKPIWPYASFGSPGTVEDRQLVKDLDVTLVRFANGVRLNIKPSKFQANQVAVIVSVGDGRLELPKDHPSPIWVALAGGYLNGGVSGIDPMQMQRALGDKIYKLGFSVGDASFVLFGDTRPSDLDTQMQVLAAYVKAPAFRAQAFDMARRGMLAQIQQVGAGAPLGVFGANLAGLLHAGDPRWSFPQAAEVEATKPEDLRALIGNTLAFGPIEVTIVGDVDADAAVQSVAATFGALPRRSSQTMPASAADSRFPAGGKEPTVLNHKGRDDQGLAAIAWPTTDAFSRTQMVPAVALLCDVMRLRLSDELRVAAGETYSAECSTNASQLLPGYGYLLASADIRPAHTQVFFDTIDKITADLRAHAPSADEMQRVQKAEVEKLKQAMQTNQYWLGLLVRVQRDPKRLELIRSMLPDLEAVKAADVQRAANTYLLDKTAYRVVVRKDTTTQPPQ